MRTRAFRISLVLVLVFVCAGAYLVGYARGHSAAVCDETKFGLLSYSALYKFAQQGDTNRLNDRLRFLIFSHYDYYERYFSNETVDTYFSKHLEEARVIAEQERTNVVTLDTEAIVRQVSEEMRTNRGPGSVPTNK
jgi:hypothetical protein